MFNFNWLIFYTDLIIFSLEFFILINCFIIFTWCLYFSINCFHNSKKLINYCFNLGLLTILISILLLFQQINENILLFNGLIILNSINFFFKIILLLSTFFYFILLKHSNEIIKKFEIVVLFLFSIFTMLTLLQSNDLILIYILIELLSLIFYILILFELKYKVTAEAGIKYFILGAFAAGLLLYGISLVYYSIGTTNFEQLSQLLYFHKDWTIKIGFLLILIGFSFKIGLIPFHFWLADVYEGAPLSITFFFSLLPKISYFGSLIQLIQLPFLSLIEIWQFYFQIIGVLTLVIGTFYAFFQRKIKRFLAYSTITHSGYMILAISLNTLQGIQAVLLYLSIYIITIIGVFALLINSSLPNRYFIELNFKNGLILNLIFITFIFSLSGIPFLAGFFTKFNLFYMLWIENFYFVVTLGLFLTLISTFYYIRIIKIMLFESSNKNDRVDFLSMYVVVAVFLLLFVFCLIFSGFNNYLLLILL